MEAIDVPGIRARLARLAVHPKKKRVFGAAHHGFALGAPWTPDDVQAFERTRKARLPGAYRAWLIEAGASGAGPGCGLFVPGTWSLARGGDGPWTHRQFGPLGAGFPYAAAVARHKGPLAGALPICDFGCGVVGLLIVSGPLAGRIWIDRRKDAGGLAPEDDLDFPRWIEAWLRESEHRVELDDVAKAPRPSGPDRVIPASSVATEEELDRLVRDATEAMRAGRKYRVGPLGAFAVLGGRARFDMYPRLVEALAGAELPAAGVMTRIVRAALDAGPGSVVEVNGLLRVGVREQRSGVDRDYLGRAPEEKVVRYLGVHVTFVP